MENASKALIIAGAILLSILIIGLGMSVFNSAREALTGANLDSTKVDAINSKYEAYIGNSVKGTKVKTLCDLVKNNNLTADESETFTVTINDVTTAEDINELKATISSGKMYSVKATYAGPSGTIDTITIEEVK